MKTKPLPPRDWLAARLDYDPDTGILRWKERPLEGFATKQAYRAWNTRFSGKQAGNVRNDLYCAIKICGSHWFAHRLAFWLYYGEQPLSIDHRDGDPSNNCISNLRACSHTENQRNRTRLGARNKSGFRGVSWDKYNKSWRAAIRINCKHKHLGWFKTPEEAGAVAKAAREKHFKAFAGVDAGDQS